MGNKFTNKMFKLTDDELNSTQDNNNKIGNKKLKFKRRSSNFYYCIIFLIILIFFFKDELMNEYNNWKYNREFVKKVQQIVQKAGKLKWVDNQNNTNIPELPCLLLITGEGNKKVTKKCFHGAYNALDDGKIIQLGNSDSINYIVLVNLEDGGSELEDFDIYNEIGNTRINTDKKVSKLIKKYSAKTWIINMKTAEAIQWRFFDANKIPFTEGSQVSPDGKYFRNNSYLSEEQISLNVIYYIKKLIEDRFPPI